MAGQVKIPPGDWVMQKMLRQSRSRLWSTTDTPVCRSALTLAPWSANWRKLLSTSLKTPSKLNYTGGYDVALWPFFTASVCLAYCVSMECQCERWPTGRSAYRTSMQRLRLHTCVASVPMGHVIL